MNKFLSVLGLARRAGKITAGFDATIMSIKEGKALIVILACDISEKTEKNIRFEAERNNIKVIKSTNTIEEISHSIGKKAGVVSISDKDFSKGLSSMI